MFPGDGGALRFNAMKLLPLLCTAPVNDLRDGSTGLIRNAAEVSPFVVSRGDHIEGGNVLNITLPAKTKDRPIPHTWVSVGSEESKQRYNIPVVYQPQRFQRVAAQPGGALR